MKSGMLICSCCGKEFWYQTTNDAIECIDCKTMLDLPEVSDTDVSDKPLDPWVDPATL